MVKQPFVVVYKRPRGRKHFIKVLYMNLEDIIDNKKRKPPIPHDYELIEIGWGEPFIHLYMEEYNIKEIDND